MSAGEPAQVAGVGPAGVEQSGVDNVLLGDCGLGGLALAQERTRLHLPHRGGDSR